MEKVMKHTQEDYKRIISETLSKARKDKNIKQQDAADKNGISRYALGRYEKGNADAPGSVLASLMYSYHDKMASFDRAILRDKTDKDLSDEDSDYIAKHSPSFFRSMTEELMEKRLETLRIDMKAGLCRPEYCELPENVLQQVEDMIREFDHDGDIRQDVKDMICETLAVNVVLFELNRDIISSPPESLEESARNRLQAYLELIGKIYRDSYDAMFDLIPPENERIHYPDARFPVVMDGFTFYVDKTEYERFRDTPRKFRRDADGLSVIETREGYLFVDAAQARAYYEELERRSQQ